MKQHLQIIFTSSPPIPSTFRRRVRSNLEQIMRSIFARFIKDQSGATAIEYGLIAALIAVVVITGLTAVGTHLNNKFNSIANAIN